MNLIGGHDVMRILTIMSEPADDLTRDQKAMHRPALHKHRLGIKRVKIMSLIQMTFPGTPSVYYGDEAGMTGFEDPFNRGTFPWNNINGELYEWHTDIISLRNTYRALRTGSFTTAYAKGPAYAYFREIKGGADVFGAPARNCFMLIAINRDKENAVSFAIDLSLRKIPALYDAFEYMAARHSMRAGINDELNLMSIPEQDENADFTAKNMQPYYGYSNGLLNIDLDPLGLRVLIYEEQID
jgi:4-alpha-glucanotransferase